VTRFLLRRLAHIVPIALLVATLVFSLLHLIPGDPIEVMLGEGAQAADVAVLRARLGLDRPLGEQYLAFLAGLPRGDLGSSLHSGDPVTAVLLEHLPATLELACAAMLVALGLALPLGTLAAFQRGRAVDHLSRAVSVLGVALPNFWLGPMLILLFSVQLGWLPVSGREGTASLVLPALTLGAGLAAFLTRLVRASVVEELARPYVATALAKGLPRRRAVVVHALRNALVPALTVAALQFGALLTGAIVTETIFSWPGLGRLLIEAIRLRDYPLVQGGVLLIAWTYLLVNLVTDLAYAWLDPRLRQA
jgi:peptide/nickel transport system permease protein